MLILLHHNGNYFDGGYVLCPSLLGHINFSRTPIMLSYSMSSQKVINMPLMLALAQDLADVISIQANIVIRTYELGILKVHQHGSS